MQQDDVVAVAGPREVLVEACGAIGPEVDDPELLDFPAEVLDVVVTNKALAGKTLAELGEACQAAPRRLSAQDHPGRPTRCPSPPGTKVDRGDVLTLVGRSRMPIERVAKEIGYADRPTNMTDMAVRRARASCSAGWSAR